MAAEAKNVFINCPFDDAFAPGFRALVFAVLACGFRARTTREIEDAAETRIDKLYRIIGERRFGIHDLSRTELDPHNGLPRFNMPFELGLFLGAKRFGGDGHENKSCLLLDVEPYRYQQFISDLNGVDLTPHLGEPRQMVECTRDFLLSASKRKTIPATGRLLDSYDRFVAGLPAFAANAGLAPGGLKFPDYERLVIAWVKLEKAAGKLEP